MRTEIFYELQEKMGKEWKSILFPRKSLPLIRNIRDRYKEFYPQSQFRIIETTRKEVK